MIFSYSLPQNVENCVRRGIHISSQRDRSQHEA